YYINIDNGVVQDANGNSFAGINDNTTWNIETFNGDFPPVLAEPIGSVRITKSSEVVNQEVDLSAVFTDQDHDVSTFTFNITSNDNPTFLGTSITGSTLTVTTLVTDQIGSAQLTLEVNSNGKTAQDVFRVSVRDNPLYEQTDNLVGTSIISMEMTDQLDSLVQLADEFIVPLGEIWDISAVVAVGNMSDADGVDNTNLSQFVVQVYGDANNAPDESNILFDITVDAEFVEGQTSVDLPVNITGLEPGKHWLSVYAIGPIETERWNWQARSSTGQEWHINDRLGFFGLTANTWLNAASVGNFAGQDLVYTLEGTLQTVLAPSGLVVEIDNSDDAVLTWVDNSDNETNYIVERSTSENSGYTLLATLAPDTETYTDMETLDGNTTYYYRVIATGSFVDSAPAVESVLTVPNAPEGLAFTQDFVTFFSLSWTAQTDIETYKLDISTDNFATFYNSFEDSTLTNISAIDIPLDNGGIYHVRMRAVNDAGASDNSAVLEVDIPILGVEEIVTFELYPNPAHDEIFIQRSELNGVSRENITVTSLSGQTRLKPLTFTDNRASVDISDLPSGIYILNFEKEGKKYQQRFIKR
ncbi:MAG: T9SS type A sorting domain-containing protein, partial [Bacteroidota bacterium]